MLETVAYVNLSVHLYCASLPVRRRLADVQLDGTLTFQQKCIALTFDVHIDPMY